MQNTLTTSVLSLDDKMMRSQRSVSMEDLGSGIRFNWKGYGDEQKLGRKVRSSIEASIHSVKHARISRQLFSGRWLPGRDPRSPWPLAAVSSVFFHFPLYFL
ncbi:hypothetical protein ACMFMG_009860 [Clarireedia jacksonii]